MWALWEGYNPDTVEFDEKGIDTFEQLSYTEYRKRFIRGEKQ